jgi:hypothetical protein
MLLNIRSPYRRQKRDLSIIRSSFRRSHWNRNTCDHTDYLTFLSITSITLLPSYDRLLFTFLPSSRPHRLLLTLLPTTTFLPSCDRLLFTFLPSSRPHRLLLTFLRPHRLLPTFLPSYDHIDYFLTSYLPTFLRSYRLPNNPYSLSQSNRAGFTMPRHGK